MPRAGAAGHSPASASSPQSPLRLLRLGSDAGTYMSTQALGQTRPQTVFWCWPPPLVPAASQNTHMMSSISTMKPALRTTATPQAALHSMYPSPCSPSSALHQSLDDGHCPYESPASCSSSGCLPRPGNTHLTHDLGIDLHCIAPLPTDKRSMYIHASRWRTTRRW
jgi:hypothetical protein